uniref:Laminin subunit alpha-2 n=3 Tax=Timema TaxID=61471 RepID=A0A7R8VIA0_TIMDO|nr:unnamed protein product [Timema douglasi]
MRAMRRDVFLFVAWLAAVVTRGTGCRQTIVVCDQGEDEIPVQYNGLELNPSLLEQSRGLTKGRLLPAEQVGPDRKRCGCHQYGSRNSMCDIVSGQCPCKLHVIGRACDYCQDGFWGLSNQGCQQCHCDPVGSNNGSCNPRTGQCPCKKGVGGQRCDICLPGHYGLTTSGCSKCDVCVKTGHICDPDTGRCVCPPHTLGPTCSLCQPNSWGFEPGKGCKPCECNGPGAIHPQCDLVTGRCSCRNGFHGDHCVSCTAGHFGFPRCQQCSCNLPGTMPDNCDTSTGQCSCDDKGQCPCKVNVESKRCDRCKLGTFGLQADNIDGCTQCFCFGRTTACTQAGLIWSQILAGPSRTLYLEYKRDKPRYKPGHKDVAYIQLLVPGSGEQNFKGDNARLNSTNNLLLVPGTAGDVRIGANHLLDKPLYWQLPSQFLGDKILSYGGYLQFTLENEDGANPAPKHVLSSQPLIQIQGNSRIILEHYPILPNPLGRYKVRRLGSVLVEVIKMDSVKILLGHFERIFIKLNMWGDRFRAHNYNQEVPRFHESLWRLKTDKKGKVSREVFMLALQNIQHVFIRTSEYLDYTKVVLRDAAMDTAVSTPGQPYPLARGVELCECPRQYNSSSCQDPSIGFYRYYDNNSITSTIVIQLLGEARPCECNNRSKVCDIETGHCLVDHIASVVGRAIMVTPSKGPVNPAPAPSLDATLLLVVMWLHTELPAAVERGTRGSSVIARYQDVLCICSYGWFGYPKRPGGFCRPCECNRHGSVSDECDEETGQCNCKPGIASRDCSECTGRTVLTDRGCSCESKRNGFFIMLAACDDECTGVLLNDLDNLAALLKKKGGHLSGGITPPPWGLLRSVEGNTSQLAMRLDQLHQLNNRVVALPTNLGEDIRRDTKQLLRRSESLGRRSDSIAQDGAFLKEETSKILTGMEKVDTTRSLDDYGQGDRGMLSISAALKEAQHLLASIKSHNLEPRRSAANKTLCYLAKDITENNRGRMGQAKVYIDQSKRLQGEIATLSAEGVNLNDKAHRLLEETELYINNIFCGGDVFRLFSHFFLPLFITGFLLLPDYIGVVLGAPNCDVIIYCYDSRNSLIELHNLTWSVEKLEGILYRLNPLYLDKYVIPAQKHVDILLRRVLNYTELFNPTRHNATVALRASKAYQDIVDALDEALTAAMNARNAGEQAYKTAHPDNEDNILDKSLVSLANSDRLLVRAKQKQDDVDKLSKELDNQRKSIKDDQEILRNAAVKDNIISRELSQLERKENSSRGMLEESLLAASNTSGTSATVYKKATDIINKVEMNLRPQLANLDYQLQLDIIEHNITQGLNNVRHSDELLTKLTEEAEERNKKFQLLNATLADKLQELRNKIMQARHAANGGTTIIHQYNTYNLGHCVHVSGITRPVPNALTGRLVATWLFAAVAPPLISTFQLQRLIHVSIKSRREEDGAGCIRSYHPSNLEPSTTTSITLNYAIESDQRNGVLLYLPSGTSNDFVAIEMVDRRIRFVWDVGHGSGTVEHPLQIKSGQLLSDIHWYKIQVDRTSNIAKLTVRPQIEPENPSQANGTSDAGFGQLDVGPGDTLWVGGIPPSIRRPQRLQSVDVQGLIGCLYQILFNGRPIGLWNFSNETYKGGCVACIQGAEERKDELSYHFTGDGYSSLRRGSSSPHNKYVFSVSFKFRTLDENALIFLAVDPLKMGFVSLTLSEGRVMFNIGYGGDLYLEILTPEKHNHGNWTIVEASRYFDRKSKKEKCKLRGGVKKKGGERERERPRLAGLKINILVTTALEKGVLKVEGESQDGEPNKQPSLSAIPDLSSAFYFVGGVPPGFSSGPNKLQVLNSYLGCLADIQVNQEGYNPLHGQFYGVEAACTFEPEVVSFQGDGYLHLASHTLKKRAAFGLSFRTLQQNTLLFLSTFEGIRPTLPQDVTEGYYSVSLSEGTLRVWANAGRGDTFLNSTNSYNDGQFHALVVTKNGRKLQLRVDDRLEGTTTLPEGATALKAPGDIGGLYLGGLPPGLNAVNMVASVVPLFGTIKDVIFNEKILQFNNPVSFDHAGIGRLGDLPAQMVSRSASAPPPPMKVEASRCHEVASNVTEPGAVKFGDSPNSHVLIHCRTAVDKKEYILELDFRTFYPNGLLFIITSTRGKNRHYLMAALRDKQLHVTVKWRRKLPVILSPALNDGMWHHVTLTKINRQLQVEVDSHPAETSKGKFPKKLNMGNIMYVGGLPQNIRALPDNLVSKHEGFKGCMRNLAINKQSQDLVGAKTTPNKVGQCFPQVERGSYFPGDAYAIYKNMFRVGIVLELELEFRTSELSGILLSVSEPQGYPALSLELNDGKVIMTGDIGDRRPLRVEQGFPSPYTLCNNKWHSIKAIFDKDELTLKVDHLNTTYGHSGNGHFDEASTNSPLYIGGLPDNAPTGTLETRDNFKGCIRNMVIVSLSFVVCILEWMENTGSRGSPYMAEVLNNWFYLHETWQHDGLVTSTLRCLPPGAERSWSSPHSAHITEETTKTKVTQLHNAFSSDEHKNIPNEPSQDLYLCLPITDRPLQSGPDTQDSVSPVQEQDPGSKNGDSLRSIINVTRLDRIRNDKIKEEDGTIRPAAHWTQGRRSRGAGEEEENLLEALDMLRGWMRIESQEDGVEEILWLSNMPSIEKLRENGMFWVCVLQAAPCTPGHPGPAQFLSQYLRSFNPLNLKSGVIQFRLDTQGGFPVTHWLDQHRELKRPYDLNYFPCVWGYSQGPRLRTPGAWTPPCCQRHQSSAFKLTVPQSPTYFWATTSSKLMTWAFDPALCTTYNKSSLTETYQSAGPPQAPVVEFAFHGCTVHGIFDVGPTDRNSGDSGLAIEQALGDCVARWSGKPADVDHSEKKDRI